MQWLKQSTAVTLKIGPFLDDGDGNTAETGLTIAQADVRLSKNGANIAQKNESTTCTHDELGIYGCPIDTTDTATLGRLQLWVHESGALQVWHEYTVVPANVYDSLFSTDKLQVDVTQVEGSDATDQIRDSVVDDSTRIDASQLNTHSGITAAAIVNEWETQSQADPTGFHVNLLEVGGTAQTANDNGADINAILTDTNELQTDWADGGRLDVILDGATAPSAATVADAVWDELATGHTSAGKAGEQLWTDLDAILADTGTDGVVLAANAITAAKIDTGAIDAGAIAADAIGSSELAATAVTEISTAVWADITSAAKQAIADELLKRGVDNVEDAADTTSLAELIMAGLNSAISGTTWTIKKPSDDSTFGTRTVTTDSSADPVVGVT